MTPEVRLRYGRSGTTVTTLEVELVTSCTQTLAAILSCSRHWLALIKLELSTQKLLYGSHLKAPILPPSSAVLLLLLLLAVCRMADEGTSTLSTVLRGWQVAVSMQQTPDHRVLLQVALPHACCLRGLQGPKLYNFTRPDPKTIWARPNAT